MNPLSFPMAYGSVISLILVSLWASFSSADEKLSAYQVVQQYDFPAGILPKGVSGYELNRETGEFSAYLNETCDFKIESYQLRYKSTIQGVISPGKISNLKGVSVKVLFFWLNIVHVIRDGEEIQFSVSITSANFPIDNFYESPQCGCGFDCDGLNGFAASI
ncbi:uncharacterized protein LOC120135314 [Hibiscus syriacus]|uniref:uncharacterized protein LOC120135314 n=1 Tax=Hibiscus syriacus TaxID=106335 RepID=UPI001922D395|nr:uncharacterized protein LOC120135314 [Hibiscus syriacus]